MSIGPAAENGKAMKQAEAVWWTEPKDDAFRLRIIGVGMRNLARFTGVSPSMLSRWLNMQSGMKASKVERIKDGLQRLEKRRSRHPTPPARTEGE